MSKLNKFNLQEYFYSTCIDIFKGIQMQGFIFLEKFLIEKYFIDKKEIILDLGCGSGREAIALSKDGYKVIAIDNSRLAIKVASTIEEPNIEFILADLLNLPFKNCQFKYALMVHCVLPIIMSRKKRIEILKEVYRVLKPGGILIMSLLVRKNFFTSLYLITKYLILTLLHGFSKKVINIFKAQLFLFYKIHMLEMWYTINKNYINEFEYGDVINQSGELHHAFSIKEIISEIKNTKFNIIEIINYSDSIKNSEKHLYHQLEDLVYLVLKKS